MTLLEGRDVLTSNSSVDFCGDSVHDADPRIFKGILPVW